VPPDRAGGAMRHHQTARGRSPPPRVPLPQAQRAHARKRALSRYGLELTDELHTLLVQRIQEGEAVLVREHPRKYRSGAPGGRCFVYELVWEGKKMHVVYDEQTKCIVTFLFVDPTMYLYEMCGY